MQPVLKKINYILLICFVFTMPFSLSHVKINSLLIILLAINSIPLFFLSKKTIEPWNCSIMILFVTVYLIHIIGMFNTDNFHEAIFELQKKLSILIFPIILFFSPRLNYKEIKTIVLCFVVSCLLSGIFCLLIATYHLFGWNDSSFFFYHNFSGIVGMHATYLSMYFCFSVGILLYIYFNEISTFNLSNKIIYYSSLFILIVSIVLLCARTQLLILVLGAILYYTFQFYKNDSVIKSIIKAITIGTFIFGMMFLFPKNRERFKEAINYKGEYSIDKKWGEGQMRYLMWDCAFELIKSQPGIGVGTGDVQDELTKCYTNHQYISLTFWKNTRFNAHNQFLETAIGLGLLGLAVFLISLFASMFHALKYKKAFYFIFILLFTISCLTESLLERQSGIVFYAFFNSLFAFNSFKKGGD